MADGSDEGGVIFGCYFNGTINIQRLCAESLKHHRCTADEIDSTRTAKPLSQAAQELFDSLAINRRSVTHDTGFSFSQSFVSLFNCSKSKPIILVHDASQLY